MILNAQTTISNEFFDYLKEHLEKNYAKESMEREMIIFLFVLAMKKDSHPKSLFQHWNMYNYSKKYSPKQAIELCENFIHNDLGYDMIFPEAIEILKIAFPKK